MGGINLFRFLRMRERGLVVVLPEDEFLISFSKRSSTRRLLRTRKDYLGLGPSGMKEGDEVCIVLGAHVPFVLRYKKKNRLQFIGEAYVHGIMHGEAVRSEGLSEEDIELE